MPPADLGGQLVHISAVDCAKAYLIGAPVPGDPDEWRKLVPVVAGRLVNAYGREDYVLAFLCRTISAQYQYTGMALNHRCYVADALTRNPSFSQGINV